MIHKFVFIITIFLCATLWLLLLTWMAPTVNSVMEDSLKFPKNLEELKSLADLLRIYYRNNYLYVVVLFISAYLYKQAFMIPGSALLNILAGALFEVSYALPLCCILTSIGASISFWISKYFGQDLIKKYWPEKVLYLNKTVEDNSHQLVYFLLFLRLFPMTPNWLLNLLSPIVGIPLHLFIFTIFIGLIPYNFVCVQAGAVLTSITSLSDVLTLKILLQLILIAVMALLPSRLIRLKNPIADYVK